MARLVTREFFGKEGLYKALALLVAAFGSKPVLVVLAVWEADKCVKAVGFTDTVHQFKGHRKCCDRKA
ncbi:hypothetical protein ABBQ38_000811 [Trebouxia sp. C0009 RCD-2024]